MRLLDLEPRWFVVEDGGPIVGLTFLCPHCQKERLGVAFHHQGHESIEDSYIKAHFPNDPSKTVWNLEGQQDFETLTLTPSIDASAVGHWHGYITSGGIS